MGTSAVEQDRFVLIGTFALASHLFFFRLVELWPNQLARLYSVLFLLDVAARHHYASSNILSSCLSTVVDLTAYTAFVLTSIGIYRLFFHRISNIPGPRSWALSKWGTFRIDLHGLRPRAVHDAHLQYGDVVRTGPREVSINSPHAVQAITSAKSDAWKGPWYSAVGGGRDAHIARNVLSMFDRSKHQRQRKAWDAAFSAKALKAYEPILINNMDTMLRQLCQRANADQVVDLDDWGILFAFDLITEVGFGKNIGLLEQGKLSPILVQIRHAMKFQQVIGNRPYMVEIARKLPNAATAFARMVHDQLQEREKNQHEQRDDIVSYFAEHERQGQETAKTAGPKLVDINVDHSSAKYSATTAAESRLIIVAGSDTSSTVMAMTLFLLLQHPQVAQKLREELDAVFGTDSDTTISDFAKLDKACPYLNGVINESMRLHPPVAGGLQKVNAHGPTVIELHSGEKIVIPKDVVMTTPTLTMHRDPRNFSPEPEVFRPERWVNPEKEDRFERKAFVPFSAGATMCPGRLLALMEVRIVIANLVRKFDMVPTDDFDFGEFEDGVRDYLVSMRLRKLTVKLKVRGGSSGKEVAA